MMTDALASLCVCDRCGVSNSECNIIGWPTDDAVYWLCWPCVCSIVLNWLYDNHATIDALRAEAAASEVAP
jgi:hypothetical protein